MRLRTKRLLLRPLREEDAEAIYENYANDPIVTRFLSWPPHADLEETRRVMALWAKEDPEIARFHFFLELRSTHELIGSINVVKLEDGIPEIGYVLGRKWWNQGYMSEACLALIRALLSHGYPKVRIGADKENKASLGVIKKCGLHYTMTKTNFYPLVQKESVCDYFEITQQEFAKRDKRYRRYFLFHHFVESL